MAALDAAIHGNGGAAACSLDGRIKCGHDKADLLPKIESAFIHNISNAGGFIAGANRSI
jgi:hypothetical protein